jgi:hypothetical protein
LAGSGVDVLLIYSWPIILPHFSILFYCRQLFILINQSPILNNAAKVIYGFYRQNRDINRFLESNGSANRLSYFRLLALVCIDILLTLPSGLISVIIEGLNALKDLFTGFHSNFYFGWTFVHSP